MRYLHPVQAHERFLASGCYRYVKDGQPLQKTESWAIHGHPDGGIGSCESIWMRGREESKSILAEALQNNDGELVRLDIRYENSEFQGGITTLSATYQVEHDRLHVGFTMNGAERKYVEIELQDRALIDVPLLVFRGRTIATMARHGSAPLPMYVPMYEHAQLFPGTLQSVASPVEYVGDDVVLLGQREIPTPAVSIPG